MCSRERREAGNPSTVSLVDRADGRNERVTTFVCSSYPPNTVGMAAGSQEWHGVRALSDLSSFHRPLFSLSLSFHAVSWSALLVFQTNTQFGGLHAAATAAGRPAGIEDMMCLLHAQAADIESKQAASFCYTASRRKKRARMASRETLRGALFLLTLVSNDRANGSCKRPR